MQTHAHHIKWALKITATNSVFCISARCGRIWAPRKWINEWMNDLYPISVAKWISVRTIRKWTNDEWTAINILATNSTYWVRSRASLESERSKGVFWHALFSLVRIFFSSPKKSKQTNKNAATTMFKQRFYNRRQQDQDRWRWRESKRVSSSDFFCAASISIDAREKREKIRIW